MKKQLIALLVLGGLTGGSLAWAVDQAPSPTKTRGPGLFLQADADQDGKLSPAEFATLQTLQQQRMAQREAKLPQFADLDTQNKGYITRDEWRGAMATQWGRGSHQGGRDGDLRGGYLLSQADKDGNGQLDQAEYQALRKLQSDHLAQLQQRLAQRQAQLPTFEQLDTGKQGYITLDQLRQAHQAMMQDDESMVCPKGLMGGRHAARWDKEAAGRGAGGQGRPEPSLFEQADKDANGQLSASEYATLLTLHQARMSARQAARGDFKTLDGNGDGFITPDELRRARPAAQN
ncbi:MAG: hypothetical protein LRY38_04735 [Aeromonadaceae bacterium]|nr:hypothetical protein [Aeromonadaceae bacterium]